MLIMWDESKRLANIEKHGLDFRDFEFCFDSKASLRIPTRASHTGRGRDIFIGWWDGRLVVVAVTSPLGREALSLVSVRPASQKERDLYDRR